MAVPRHEAVHDLDDPAVDDRRRRHRTGEIIGASPFPRHWLYDDDGRLLQKSALTRNQVWARTVFGHHTPWGGEDEAPEVAEPETQLERALADQIMQVGQPSIRTMRAGDFLFRQNEKRRPWFSCSTESSRCGWTGEVVGRAGPGSVVGERAPLEAGRRTADIRATTDARVAEVPSGTIDIEQLSELAQGHHREDASRR